VNASLLLMPSQNRVTPFGEIIATPERGTIYGNRGCLVDSRGKIKRQFKEIRWIICVLDFKGRRHPMMAPGRYTGLFFLDEATALAAGHRPCAECQRQRFNIFRETWAAANRNAAEASRPLAPVIDAVLHRERMTRGRVCNSIEGLPDGTLVSTNNDAYLVLKNELRLWTPAGYKNADKKPEFPVNFLTPPSIVAALASGYPVSIHPTAF
jgi:hypothetical protein